ncbi:MULTISPECIES: alpha/beta hydrolase [unclassified Hyphomicrobium]|uniref:alpha/beta hydrolase n=1 Tax=unclassified Hyphomicrobium TaxID=2619925 RepID=UPI000213F8D5|nr:MULTISPECIES: alpha/beta fold hydrolase [unclassified Hyphomicrobium]CCB63559.1 Alpha/beta hydrolase fold protein [Hyphomicrobium sp. MC1]
MTVAAFTAISFPAMAWTEQDIVHKGLAGSLIPATGGKPGPMVLILPGSGPVDRDGNAPGMDTDSLKLVARGFADLGISSLRIDKRGVGESYAAGPRVEDLRFGTYVDDAISWLDFLRNRPDVSKLFILGHSEGALVGTLAAKKTRVTGLILLEGAGRPIADVLARQLASAGVSPKLQGISKQITERLEHGVAVPNVPAELVALYQPRVQGYLMSWMPLDPAAELSAVTCPVLIVQGSTDLQVFLDDAHQLSTALPSARLVVISGMNHILKEAPEDRAQNFATYGNSFLPLDPQLLPVLADFVRKH